MRRVPTSSVFDYRPRARRGGGGHSPPSLSLSSPGCAPHWGSGQRLASRLPSSPPARGSALYFAGSVLHFPWGEEKSFVAYRVKTTPGHMQGPALNPWLVSSRAKLPTRRVLPSPGLKAERAVVPDLLHVVASLLWDRSTPSSRAA